MVRVPAIRTAYSGPETETYRWQDDAACRGVDPKYFEFQDKEDPDYTPERGMIGDKIRILGVVGSNRVRLEKGQAVCLACPVAEECIASADGADVHNSLRGGYMPTRVTHPNLTSPASSYVPKITRNGQEGKPSPRKGAKMSKSETCRRNHNNWRPRKDGSRECIDCSTLRNRARAAGATL